MFIYLAVVFHFYFYQSFFVMIVIICSFNIFFSRYQRLHKLIFEDDGLPDGAEVAYYARGQVVFV